MDQDSTDENRQSTAPPIEAQEPSARSERINIRPGVGILSVLRHLNYQPWFALAEFVDNALQSYLREHRVLRTANGERYKLEVAIQIDSTDDGRITIRDNAAGIHQRDYARAFRPAELPPDRSGLGEFGMGMKSAACWFSPRWYVRTSALGEPVERTVRFDVNRIVSDSLEELEIHTRAVGVDLHYTEVVLLEPFNLPQGRTVSKIKEHLTDIYRFFLRSGELRLLYNDEPLYYEEPKILVAPRYKQPDGQALRWRKEIDFDFGTGLRARGFAALRETGSTRRAGFALFRRKRLVQGSGDEGYRPPTIFGASTSYRFQRLFGELHLEGFEVSHTKDGFRWDENEEPFLDLLREELDGEPLPLLKQAENWRSSTREIRAGAEEAVERTALTIQREIPSALEQLDPEPSGDPPEQLPNAEFAARRVIPLMFRSEDWEIIIELTNNPAVGDWLEISDGIAQKHASGNGNIRRIGIRLALAHPFMIRFGGNKAEQIEPLLRVAAGLALAEHAASASGVKYAGTIRRNLNDLLREAFSKES